MFVVFSSDWAVSGGWEAKMSSKDILETYIDRDVLEAFGENAIHKIIDTETGHRLSDAQIQTLTTAIQRKQDRDALERTRRNISQLEFRTIIETEDQAGQRDPEQSDRDGDITRFISRLENLSAMLDMQLDELQDEQEGLVKELATLVRSEGFCRRLETGARLHTLDRKDVTDEIRSFCSQAVEKHRGAR